MSYALRNTALYISGEQALVLDAFIPIEWRGAIELIGAAQIPIEAMALLEGSAQVPVESLGSLATVTVLQIEILSGAGAAAPVIPIEWQAALLVTADPTIPIEAMATVTAAPRIPFESSGVILLEADANLPLEILGGVIGRALLQLEVSGRDDTVLAYVWKVLVPADVPQAFRWVVLPEIVVGAELGLTWRVFEDPGALGLKWRVIPGEILDLFDSEGQGAAAGIGDDVLLPVGRATKE